MKTVYVLGAGSSISHTNGIFPNIGQIFNKARDLGVTCENGEIKDEYKLLNDYIVKYFDKDLLTKDQLDFETVHTMIEIEMEKNPTSFNLVNRQLIELLQNVFMKLKDKLGESCDEYNQFVGHIKFDDTILTFNWDILLDDALGRIDMLNLLPNNGIDCVVKGTRWTSQYEWFFNNYVRDYTTGLYILMKDFILNCMDQWIGCIVSMIIVNIKIN